MLEKISYMDIILTSIAILLGFIVIKITISFDINSWLKDRRKIKIYRLQNICPHVTILKDGKGYRVIDDFSSPPGTFEWQCQTCKRIAINHIDNRQYWIDNPNDYYNRKKLFEKGLKRIGL